MARASHSTKQHGAWFHILDVLFNVVVIVAIVTGIRSFLVTPFQVEGNSMATTLLDNEYIVINKLAYHVGEPQRGDIVVFHPPGGDRRKYYVKRVIGVPGDTVTIEDGRVFVQSADASDAVELTELYLDERNSGKTFRHPPGGGDRSSQVFHVPDDRYFLLGDNRLGSLDSRSFSETDGSPAPYVPEESIKGRVWFVALPIAKIHAFEAPEYAL